MPNAEFFAEHFGMTERPFTLLPDPDFIYWSPAHKRAYAVLEYGVLTRSPITVITGEVGAGKTTLIQNLLQNLDDDTTVGLISNAQGTRRDLLKWVLNALEIESQPEMTYVQEFQALQDFLVAQYSAGRRVLVIIDEAQNLSVEALEELRMLTNINTNKDELVQLIIVGQPELRELISRHELRQFAQRVTATYHIPNMTYEITVAYMQHRLKHAGGTGEEFSEDAMALIHQSSEGVPRLVNKYADFAMVYAATSNMTRIEVEIIEEILNDGLFLHQPPARRDAAE
jgi:type II secretory pathway predicted ATPase ExeA